jgi:hypothetical protein
MRLEEAYSKLGVPYQSSYNDIRNAYTKLAYNIKLDKDYRDTVRKAYEKCIEKDHYTLEYTLFIHRLKDIPEVNGIDNENIIKIVTIIGHKRLYQCLRLIRKRNILMIPVMFNKQELKEIIGKLPYTESNVMAILTSFVDAYDWIMEPLN